MLGIYYDTKAQIGMVLLVRIEQYWGIVKLAHSVVPILSFTRHAW